MNNNNEFDPKSVFHNPIQIGVLTKDLDKFLDKLENVFGIGPWRIAKYPPEGNAPFMEYKGKNGNFKANFCFVNLGNIELEVIQPLEGENIWDDFMEHQGNSIHHIKWLIDDHKPVEEYMNKNGYSIIQQGEGVGPNAGKRWAFYNTFEDIGFDIEVMNQIPEK